jgi:phage terminase large subunit-like protein
LASDTSKLDGLGASFFLQDEGHEAKSFEVWNILKTSQGAIENPLAVGISTCGFHIGETYPLYNQWAYGTRILNGIIEDDSWFFALYQIDESDDWKDEKVWIKANPSLGQTVGYDYMRDQIRSAINTPSNEVSIKTKNLNMWCQSADVWIQRDYIQSVMQHVNIEDYQDEITFGGVDLSSVNDLTATSICIPPNPDRKLNGDKFIFKTWLYIPQEALEISANKEYYREWIRRGWAIKTAGNVVDYEYILKDQLETGKTLSYVDIGYDSYNATQYTINAEEAGLPMAKYSQTLSSFNGPTKFIQMLILSGKCIIDSNPAVDWMFGNVELIRDHNDNVKPYKANGDKNAKIDGVISMCESLGTYLASNYYEPSAWILT